LDRRTDDPDGSGGASPTVVTSRQDGDDPLTNNGQDTRPVGIIAASPVLPRTPDDATSAPLAWDAPAVGSTADEDRRDGSDGAAADVVAASDGSATDAAGASAFESAAVGASAFSFSPQVYAPDSPGLDSWSTGPVSWSLSDPGEPSAAGSLATGTPAPSGPDADPPFARPSFSAARTDAPPTVSPPPAPPPAPDPPAVSAAAFTWEAPDPPPTSPSSPARNFLRSAGPGTAQVPARPPVTVGPPRAAAVQRPAQVRKAPPRAASRRSVRQAHLTIARVEPWSVMKFSFVVSLVAFIILFVVVTVLWGALSALGVFDSLQRVVSNVTSSQDSSGVNATQWFSASRVLGWTALLGSLNIVLITAMSTIGAVVYNLTSRLIGGVEVTLRETE
jgi:hypothetical protein